jgi:hypothetical protein
MIRSHEFDREESLLIYEKHSNVIERKGCYNNVFNLLSRYPQKFSSKEWQVAYGYIQAIPGLYVRHCFIVTNKGKAIDPTIGTFEHCINDAHNHKSFVILDVDRYLKLLLKHEGEPSLFYAFREDEKKMGQWARRNNVLLSG